MYSTASERESLCFLNEIEQFRSAFHQIFHLSSAGEMPVTIMMFQTKEQFEPYQPLYKGKPKSAGGYYHRNLDEDIIALSEEAQTRGGPDGYNVIFHEYVHKMLREQGLKPPVWLDEGLAQFYATMRIKENSVEIGLPAQMRLNEIAHNAMIGLDKLFAVSHSSPEYNEAQQTGVLYAESWLLVHYLICGANKNIQGKCGEFFDAAMNDTPDSLETHFRRVFGMSYSQMEIALRDYTTGGRFKVSTIKLPVGDFRDKIHFEPVSDVERDTILENLHWRIRAETVSGLRLLRLTERDPQAARPYEVLAAYALARDHDKLQAIEYWEKAVEHNSDNAYVYVQLAKNRMRGIMDFSSLDFRAPAAVADPIRKYLDRAVELRPNYLEAWEALARIEAYAERPRPSVVIRVQNCLPMMRSKTDTLAALAIIRWRIGDLKTCREILDLLKTSSLAQTNVRNIVNRLNEKLAQAEAKNKTEEGVELVAPAPIDRP
jgi:tetratricopeptide (TPR) repeat protein